MTYKWIIQGGGFTSKQSPSFSTLLGFNGSPNRIVRNPPILSELLAMTSTSLKPMQMAIPYGLKHLMVQITTM